ncbi:MAG: type IX secretion system protein PorQ [Duncaniella sp.]|nr:type IX secretion system protein PorQ [Duncaniella sp.]
MSIRLRFSLLAIILLAVLPCLRAQDGEAAYSFLNIPSSTLAYGLGGINISNISDDVNAADRNPGLLGPEVEMQLGVNYMRYIGDSNFAGVKFGRGAGDHGAWAAGVQYYGYGAIKGADVNGVLTGEFSPKEMVFSGTYAHDISDRWRGGGSVKFVYSSFDEYNAFAVAADLGVNYYNPDADFSFSAMVANLGGQVKRFNEKYDRLPVDVRLGASKSFGSLPIVFSITAWNLTKWHLPYYHSGDGTESADPELKDNFGGNLFRHLIFGAEFVPTDKFRIGLGYNYKTRTDMSAYKRSFLSGFSASLGLNVRNFALGVAFAQPHSGATTLMVNISTNLYEFTR